MGSYCTFDSIATFFTHTQDTTVGLCTWVWQDCNPVLAHRLFIYYCQSTGKYYAVIRGSSGGPPMFGNNAPNVCGSGSVPYGTDITQFITCTNGVLSGTFTLAASNAVPASLSCQTGSCTVMLNQPCGDCDCNTIDPGSATVVISGSCSQYSGIFPLVSKGNLIDNFTQNILGCYWNWIGQTAANAAVQGVLHLAFCSAGLNTGQFWSYFFAQSGFGSQRFGTQIAAPSCDQGAEGWRKIEGCLVTCKNGKLTAAFVMNAVTGESCGSGMLTVSF